MCTLPSSNACRKHHHLVCSLNMHVCYHAPLQELISEMLSKCFTSCYKLAIISTIYAYIYSAVHGKWSTNILLYTKLHVYVCDFVYKYTVDRTIFRAPHYIYIFVYICVYLCVYMHKHICVCNNRSDCLYQLAMAHLKLGEYYLAKRRVEMLIRMVRTCVYIHT